MARASAQAFRECAWRVLGAHLFREARNFVVEIHDQAMAELEMPARVSNVQRDAAEGLNGSSGAGLFLNLRLKVGMPLSTSRSDRRGDRPGGKRG